MENPKVVFFTLICFLVFSCGERKKQAKSMVPLYEKILYKDTITHKVYIKLDTDSDKRSDYFSNDIGLTSGKIVSVEQIVDTANFRKIPETKCYYTDGTRFYAIKNDDQASFPRFIEIKIDQEKLIIIDSISIGDGINTYRNGFILNL
ncbi:MAG: hypothetical protein Q4G27_09690 [Flavobacteriaceae bacterium]|nr:hypothetical protein [Flavobacteriaceae bacterium]